MVRVIHIFTAIVMVSFAAFQQNDPDGTTWMVIYGAAAILSGFAAAGRYYPVAALALWWLYIGMSALLVPDVVEFLTNSDGIGFSEGMENSHPYIERSREFGGLLIASVIAGWTYLVARRKKGADASA